MTASIVTVAAWVVLGIPTALTTTMVGGRLLGARRGWASLVVAGCAGFAAGVLAAGALTGWEWAALDMVLLTLLFGLLATMVLALGLDLVAPVGSLARGDAAGLVTVRGPVTSLRRTVAPFGRYREVVGFARANGVTRRGASDVARPAQVRATLEAAGGIFVKLGQVASTRADVLPREWCDELAGLRSAAAPVADDEMRRHLTTELGADPSAVFASFDWTPMASASISQVYAATLHDGAPVVVKVQRPGLPATVERDSVALLQLARLVERRTPLGLSVKPAEFAAEILDSVRDELDFRIEAANARELAAALAGWPGVRVPAVHGELSNGRVLVQERVMGPSIGELTAGRGTRPGCVDRHELADRLVGLFVHQIFGVGVFHADPHPGNLLVTPDGTIVLIDLGAVGRLGRNHRDAVLDMMVAASVGDAVGMRQGLARIAPFDRRVDLRSLEAAMEAFLAQHMRGRDGIDVTAFEDLALLIGQYGIRLPRWFATLSRTMVTLEGTIKGLDPSFSFVDAARQHAAALVRAEVGDDPRAYVEQALGAELVRLRHLPERVDDALAQLVSGRLSAQISLLSDDRDIGLVTRLADRFVLGIVAAAASITSVLLLGVDSGPQLGGSVSVNEVVGYLGLAIATVLSLRVVGGVIRDGET